MKISDTTIAILKNFATINTNLVVSAGNEINTMARERNVLASATVEETFPSEFSIFNLVELLGVLAMFKEPDIEFHDKFATISEGKNTIRYVFADKKGLVYPEKKLKMGDVAVEFTLGEESLARIIKSAQVLSAPDIEFRGCDGKVVAIIQDAKNEFSNQLTIDLDTETDQEFNVFLKVERLKVQPGTYKVELTKNVITKFTNVDKELCYWIASESNSSFKG